MGEECSSDPPLCSNVSTTNKTTPYTQLWHTQIQPKCRPWHNPCRNQSALGWSWVGILKLLTLCINTSHLHTLVHSCSCSALVILHSSSVLYTLHYKTLTVPCYRALYMELNKDSHYRSKQVSSYNLIITRPCNIILCYYMVAAVSGWNHRQKLIFSQKSTGDLSLKS